MSQEEKTEAESGITNSELALQNEKLKQHIEKLEQELLEVRQTMLARIALERARRKINISESISSSKLLKSEKIVAFRKIVKKVQEKIIVDKHLEVHQKSSEKRDMILKERRECAHARLTKRRLNGSQKTKKGATKVLPGTSALPSQAIGTNACDVHDFEITIDHGPMGLHLEEIHDHIYGTYVGSVIPGSQADFAGLKTGDILTALDDIVLEDVPFDDAIQMLMASNRPVKVCFRRRLKVFCDHAEGEDGQGKMHGRIYSLNLDAEEPGFTLSEQTNSTISGVRFDTKVDHISAHGEMSGTGLKIGDVLLGINGDSVGDLGYEDTYSLLQAVERPACLHFFRFTDSAEEHSFQVGTDYLHEEVIMILQYARMVVDRGPYNLPDGIKLSSKEKLKIKSHIEAVANLEGGQRELVEMLEKDSLHTHRSSVMMAVAAMRGLFASVDQTMADLMIMASKKMAKRRKRN